MYSSGDRLFLLVICSAGRVTACSVQDESPPPECCLQCGCFCDLAESEANASYLRRPCLARPLPCCAIWLNYLSGAETREGVGASGRGGRVGVTREMEVDVMKGLVLAQHARIERQRSRMQELERDLRWVTLDSGFPSISSNGLIVVGNQPLLRAQFAIYYCGMRTVLSPSR